MRIACLIVAGLCLTGLVIRSAYEAAKAAGRVHAGSRATFAVVCAAMVVMLVSWPVMAHLDPWRVAVPAGAHVAGLAAVTAAVCLAVGGLWQLRGLEDIDHLVTTGLYARLRHPMYTGFVLWIAGWIVAQGAVVSLALAPIGIGCILSWRRREEGALQEQFGEAYRRYRLRTWL